MSKINLGRVLVGGIVAGIVCDIFEDVLNGVVLADQWPALMSSINRSPLGMDAIIAFNLTGLLLGLAAIWTYAAIRPRFGAGPKTAVYAALLIWVTGYLITDATPVIMGVFSPPLTATLVCVGLVEIVIATLAGAYFYKE